MPCEPEQQQPADRKHDQSPFLSAIILLSSQDAHAIAEVGILLKSLWSNSQYHFTIQEMLLLAYALRLADDTNCPVSGSSLQAFVRDEMN